MGVRVGGEYWAFWALMQKETQVSDKQVHSRRVSNIDTALRKRIKSVRLQQGVTQAAIAERLGIVPQQYHKYESGVLRLSGGMLSQIAAALDCSVLDLLPESVERFERLEDDMHLDILKQEITELIIDMSSTEILVAIKTLIDHNHSSDRAAA